MSQVEEAAKDKEEMTKAKIKSHTDLHQSKILSDILTPESADLWYHGHGSPWESERIYDEEPESYHSAYPQWDKPCWSFAVLLDILPNGIIMNKDSQNGRYHFSSTYIGTFVTADNPVDACVTMIEKLHELKIL